MRVGVVGTGAMGAHLVRRIAGWSEHEVVLLDRDPAAAAAAAVDGTILARTADDLASCEVVVLTVGGDAAASIADDLAAALAPGTVLCLSGTLAPAAAAGIAERLGARGLRVVDAPLGGGEPGVRDGTATVFLGGDVDAVETAQRVYRASCAELVHCGRVGAGQVAKLANNLLLWASVSATVEAMRIGAGFGVDPATLRAAMLVGPGRTWALQTWERPRTMPWADEDLAIVLESAGTVGADASHARLIRESMAAIAADRAERGMSAASLADWIEDAAR